MTTFCTADNTSCYSNSSDRAHRRRGTDLRNRAPLRTHSTPHLTMFFNGQWVARWTRAQKGLGSNRSRDAVGYTNNLFENSIQQQQQQHPFNGPLSGTTRVSRYQKEHSPTHTHPAHRASFITFLHLQRSMVSSLFNLRA